MKTFLSAALLTCILIPIASFASCDTTLEIKLFSAHFDDAREVKGYSKIIKRLKQSGVKTLDSNASFHTVIEAGIEKAIDDGKDSMLSHITVTNKKGEVVFDDSKIKKVSSEKDFGSADVLKHVARHIRREYPTCGLE